MDRDKLGDELKLIMEEESKDIEISPGLIDKILIKRKITWKDKINDFLNKEVEIPLVTVIVSLSLAIIIITIPMDLVGREKIKVVNIGSTQIIFREGKKVSRND